MAPRPTMTEVQVITEPLGGSPLSRAAQNGTAPARWYRARPTDATEWRAYARDVTRGFPASDWLVALEPALGVDPSGPAAERLRRVIAERGIVVTSGQQPGLFGGPVYTFSKALTALALADELETRIGVPVAPVFWAATDDADFEEARSTNVVIDGDVARLALHDAPPPGTPLSATPLGDVSAELDQLDRASGSAAFEPALEAVHHAYTTQATVGNAFVALLRALLEPLGIAVLDASHPAVRRRGAAVLTEALARAPAVARALRARSAELRAAGFEPQVDDVDDLSLVFSLRDGRRRRVPIENAKAALEVQDPATLSPNVLLRPVLERAILPTVAYAAGPAELAYFAQVSAVAEAIGAEVPLAVPRWSGTVIERHVGRMLRRLGVDYTDLRDPHALEGKLARAALPSAVPSAFARVREVIERAAAALEGDPGASTLLPSAAVVGAKRSLFARLERLERRYIAGVKRREARLMRDVAAARAQLFPNGERQERALNFIPMLARHGLPLLEAMRNAAAAHAAALVGSESPAVAASPRPEPAQGRAGA